MLHGCGRSSRPVRPAQWQCEARRNTASADGPKTSARTGPGIGRHLGPSKIHLMRATPRLDRGVAKPGPAVSRVLFPLAAHGGFERWSSVWDGRRRPPRAAYPRLSPCLRLRSGLDGRCGSHLAAYLALLRLGVTVPPLLPAARWALTPPFHPYHPWWSGGLFSVALSVASRRPGVTWQSTRWSSDFPRK